MTEKETERLSEFTVKLNEFHERNKEIGNEIKYLTYHILKHDLEEAVKCHKGYYKNKKGVYRYVKGIEVTNDLSNLGRMGFNGEDRGVWVHFVELDDRKCGYYDVPISTFYAKLDTRFTDPDELMEPTTKEDFERQVKKTIGVMCEDYPEKRDPQEYLDYMNEGEKLWDDYKDMTIIDYYGMITNHTSDKEKIDEMSQYMSKLRELHGITFRLK